MEAFSKLLTATAALVSAIVWPLLFGGLAFVFRKEIRLVLGKAPALFERIRKASLAGISLELDRVAADEQGAANAGGKVTPRQIEAAARIEVQARDIDSQSLLNELDQLCLQYDALRRSLPSGPERTGAMTGVLIKMRSLAPSLVGHIDAYKGSGSPGSRLAAIAMMQMVPRVADLDWLKERFSSEHPFVFYHAALALQNVANNSDTLEKERHLRKVAEEALAIVKGFSGPPDRNTIQILEMLISTLAA
jgi:hypothetical protein